MTSQLISAWSDYDDAVQNILELSAASVEIFDEDLSPLKLERPERITLLRRLLSTHAYPRRLTLIVQKPDFVQKHSPRLMELLAQYAPLLTITQSPSHLDTLKDSLLIVDDKHALVRFHRDHARARLIVDDATECAPYRLRYQEILAAGGDSLSPTTLGL